MAHSQYYTAAALTVFAGKTVYTFGKYWWNRRSQRDRIIESAAQAQKVVEKSSTVCVEDSLANPEPDVKRAVKHAGSFRNFLVKSGQAKFGCPTRNEANRLVVRKYLYDICVDHGLLARHIVDHLDIATELVFVPSNNILVAAAIRHTQLSVARQEVYNDLNGPRPTVA